MSYTLRKILDRLFRSKEGKVVILQFPNIPLWGWIIFTILAMFIKHGKPHGGFHLLGQSFLFAWAYLEVRDGDNIFRKVLGALTLISITISYFR